MPLFKDTSLAQLLFQIHFYAHNVLTDINVILLNRRGLVHALHVVCVWFKWIKRAVEIMFLAWFLAENKNKTCFASSTKNDNINGLQLNQTMEKNGCSHRIFILLFSIVTGHNKIFSDISVIPYWIDYLQKPTIFMPYTYRAIHYTQFIGENYYSNLCIRDDSRL